MMKRLYIFLAVVCCVSIIVTVASAQTAPRSDDGPWITLPDGQSPDAANLTPAELVAMANLDGDPTVTSAEEIEMLLLLEQVLGTTPITH